MCIDPHQTGSVGEGNDHIQLIKFWPSCAHRKAKGVCGGAKFFWLRLTTASVVFASLCALFSFDARVTRNVCWENNYFKKLPMDYDGICQTGSRRHKEIAEYVFGGTWIGF